MKRRRKIKRRGARREKFSFAQLEPRKLLAADGLFSASMGADFIGPLYPETTEPVCVVQSEKQSETDVVEKTEQGELQDVAEPEVCNDEQVEEANKSPSFDYSELPESLPNGFLFNAYDEVASVDLGEFRFSATGDFDGLQDVTDSATASTNFADPEPFEVYVYNGTGTITFSRNDLTGATSLETPVETDAKEGVYFQEKPQEPTVDAAKVNDAKSKTSAGVEMLAQRQLFALISPTGIDRMELPASATAKTADPGSNLHSLATPIRTDSVDGNTTAGNFGDTVDAARRTRTAPLIIAPNGFTRDTRSSIDLAPTGSLPNDRHVERAAESKSPVFLPYTLLGRLFGDRGSNGPSRVDETPSAERENSGNESKSNDGLARSVQIVESAIILIGLPSSRVCRDDGTGDKSGV
jgi:hypothetical protein